MDDSVGVTHELIFSLPGGLGRALEASLTPGERVLASLHTSVGEAIAVTPSRILILKAGLFANAGMFGNKAISYSFQDISSVENREGPLGGHVKILAAGVQESGSAPFQSGVHSTWGKNSEAENVVTYGGTKRSVIRKVVALIQAKTDIARRRASEQEVLSNDIATQLTRLGELHVTGELSDAEFDSAKRRVLGA